VRAILSSRLRTRIVTPGGWSKPHAAAHHGESCRRAAERESSENRGECTFSALLTLPDGSQQSLDAFYDDGTHGDLTAGDGDYYARSFPLPRLAGVYALDCAVPKRHPCS